MTVMVRTRMREINQPTTPTEWMLKVRTVQLLAVTAALVGVAVLISYPILLTTLAATPAGQASAAVFTGVFFTVRLILLGLSSVEIGRASCRERV